MNFYAALDIYRGSVHVKYTVYLCLYRIYRHLCMSSEQLNITCSDEVDEYVETLRETGAGDTRSEVGLKLLKSGIERHRQRQRKPPGTNVLKQCVWISFVASILALSVGVGLTSTDVLQLAGGFAGVTALFALIYGAMLLHARKGLLQT